MVPRTNLFPIRERRFSGATLCRGRPSRTPLQKLGSRLVCRKDCKIPAPILSSDPSLQALFYQILA